MVKIKEPTRKDLKMLSYYASIDVPYYFLPRTLRDWLETGGLERLEKEKPTIAKWIKKMRKDIFFPEDIKMHGLFLRQVEDKMKEKGCLDEGQIIYQSEVDGVLRFKYDPLNTKSLRYRCIAQSAAELLEERLKKEPDREDIKELKKIFEHWVKLNKAARGN